MGSVKKGVVGTYLRNQNQFINRFTTLSFWKSINGLSCYRRACYRRKVFCIGHLSEQFTEEWRDILKDMDNKCRDLLLQEQCKKIFLLMDSFWDERKDFNFDVKWLFKVRNHLEKLVGNLQETKRKKLSDLSKMLELKS